MLIVNQIAALELLLMLWFLFKVCMVTGAYLSFEENNIIIKTRK